MAAVQGMDWDQFFAQDHPVFPAIKAWIADDLKRPIKDLANIMVMPPRRVRNSYPSDASILADVAFKDGSTKMQLFSLDGKKRFEVQV